MKIKFRVWDKRNNRMIKPKKFATVIPVLDFNGNLGVMDTDTEKAIEIVKGAVKDESSNIIM